MAKSKVKLDLKKFDEFKKKAYVDLAREVSQEIIEDLKKGISPVRGVGAYKSKADYSEKYKDYKWSKLNRPKYINLVLTGEMIKSLSTEIKNNALEIFFTDEKAEWHNDGLGNMPQRKILPTKKNEKFNNRISKRIKEIIEDIASRFF